MSSGRIVTSGISHIMQQPPKFEADIIKDNTNKNGVISCHKCDSGNLTNIKKPIRVSLGFKSPTNYDISTLFCSNCDYIYLEDQEVADIRKYLSK